MNNKCTIVADRTVWTDDRIQFRLLVSGVVTTASISFLGVLPLNTAGTNQIKTLKIFVFLEISIFLPSTTKGRLEAEVNVLLRVQTDDEGWDVDDLKLKNCKKL